MFTNATLLSLYAQARRDEDLRTCCIRPPQPAPASRPFLRRLLPHRVPSVVRAATQPR